MFFSPGIKKEVNYMFAFDSNGRIYTEKQRLRPIPQPVDKSWRPDNLQVKASKTESEWTLEFSIPFSAFEDGAPKPGDKWNFNFVCTKASNPQSVSGFALTGGNHHNLDMYGILHFVEPSPETIISIPYCGNIKIKCANTAWRLAATKGDCPQKSGQESGDCPQINEGISEIKIELASNTAEPPPEVTAEWMVPQKDIHGIWSVRGKTLGIRPDWNGGFVSQMNQDIPVYALMDANDENRLTVAVDDSVGRVGFKAGVNEESCNVVCKWTLFAEPGPARTNAAVRLRFDSRRGFWADSVCEAADWASSALPDKPAHVPSAANEALDSTWYAFHQRVGAAELEEELEIAASLGMKTVIVDDGWQTDDANRGYAFCGDWDVSKSKFPDMKAHIARVHKLGMKYMLWYGVPVLGNRSANWERMRRYALKPRGDNGVVLDPRFAEVREFLIGKWESAVREWDVDGFKLDFLCNLRGGEPAHDGDGRDIADLHKAIG